MIATRVLLDQLSQQVEELLAQIDLMREELENVRRRLHQPASRCKGGPSRPAAHLQVSLGMRHQQDFLDEPQEQPAVDYRPKDDEEWSDRDFGIDEDVDPADRRRDPLRR